MGNENLLMQIFPTQLCHSKCSCLIPEIKIEMLWGENRGKWKARQLLGIKLRTPLRQDALSIYSEQNHSAWVLSWWREFFGRLLTEFWWHILSGYWTCNWDIQYHLRSTYGELWGLVVVRQLWLSGLALVVQARSVLGSTPGESPTISLSSIFTSCVNT